MENFFAQILCLDQAQGQLGNIGDKGQCHQHGQNKGQYRDAKPFDTNLGYATAHKEIDSYRRGKEADSQGNYHYDTKMNGIDSALIDDGHEHGGENEDCCTRIHECAENKEEAYENEDNDVAVFRDC